MYRRRPCKSPSMEHNLPITRRGTLFDELRAVIISSYNDLWLCSPENDCVHAKFNDCVRNPKMIVLWCKRLCCVQNPVYFGLEHNHLHLSTIIFGLRTQSLNFAWTQSFSGEHNHRSLYELMVTALSLNSKIPVVFSQCSNLV